MKRYFFFDIDGTLTSPLTACVPEDSKEAIRQLQAKGNFVALATGRLQCDAYHIAQQLGIRSVVSDGGNGLTIDGSLMKSPLDACYAFLDDLDDSQYPWAITIDNKMKTQQGFPLYAHRTGNFITGTSFRRILTIVPVHRYSRCLLTAQKRKKGRLSFMGSGTCGLNGISC